MAKVCEARMRISVVRVVNYIVFKVIQFASNQDGAKITNCLLSYQILLYRSLLAVCAVGVY